MFSPNVDRLESRDLQAVVSLDNGVLSCYSDPDPDGGLTYVEVSYYNDLNHLVVFSGEDTYFFNTADVNHVVFYSSYEGGDFFNNATDIGSTGVLLGEDNTFVGGGGYDEVFDYAINSYVDDLGGGLDYHNMNN